MENKKGESSSSHTYANKTQKGQKQKQQSRCLPSAKRPRLQGIEHTADVESVKFSGEPTLIVIDLETTDLIRYPAIPHITQIAAAAVVSRKKISMYVRPKVQISAEAQRITGISSTRNGKMFLKGKPVDCVSIRYALKNLFRWLQEFSNVILVAHNGRRFDFPILMKAVVNNNMTDTFVRRVPTLIDSLEVFQEKFPEQSSHKQEDLVRKLLGVEYEAHNAEADVKALCKLLKKYDPSELSSFRFTPETLM